MKNISKLIKQISFRTATVEDVKILIDYRIQFLKEIGQKFNSKLDAELRCNLQEYFAVNIKAKKFVALIAEIQGKPVGFGGMVIRSQPGNFQVPQGRTGYILNMYTVAEYRRKGIGKEILKLLLNEGNKLNLDRIDLEATEMGEPLYRNLGFNEPYYRAMKKYLD
ncbi:MAG: hypothetical protein B1H06_07035 [Candidatus Cloacimonas sp. 4484_143]|nr:MAG: hypothetical protein B1H06_07035 [Candidatus Cloacimonas sp. 4484_143]RLC53834.1 MAG: hypothetical protein DRH79_02475 [Candidatus Cloacimonadota bacterium]